MDSYLNPPTPKAVSAGEPANVTFSPTTMKNWAVSSEAMHEMLGSFYIWTTIRTSDGADLLKDRGETSFRQDLRILTRIRQGGRPPATNDENLCSSYQR